MSQLSGAMQNTANDGAGRAASREQLALLTTFGTTPEAVAAARKLLATADWSRLAELAQYHAVVPLLYRWLREHAQGVVPPHHFAAWREHYHLCAAWSLQATHILGEVVGLLEAAGIEAMPLRGAVMALQAYGDPLLRQFTDLDLLVRPHDLSAAYLALGGAGYRSVFGLPMRPLPGLGKPLQPTVEVRRDACIVELHSAAMEKRLVDTVPSGAWWDETATVELQGRAYQCLAPVNNLLLAAVHGTKHRWRRLKWIADLSALLAQTGEDERYELLARAQQHGLLRMVTAAVALADALREDPAAVQRHLIEIEQAKPRRLEMSLERVAGVPDLGVALMEMRAFLEMKDRRHHLYRGYLSRLLSPRAEDIATTALPGWLTPIYYPIRAARLLGRAAAMLPGRRTQ